MMRAETIHASAVLLGECGIIVRGASGTGKSALVAELLMLNTEAACLVADDRVAITAFYGRLVANVPFEIAGLLEASVDDDPWARRLPQWDLREGFFIEGF